MKIESVSCLQKEIEDLKIEIKKLKSRKKYGLVWDTEKEPEQAVELCKDKLPVLTEDQTREIKNDSKNTNILIEGDNYHSLSVLNYTHKGKIDVIYIDPPYNTGNKDFKYNDRFVDLEDTFRHSKWLSFMNRRLKLAKELLSDDGLIFISIDNNEMAQLKLLCDEIFGEVNFVESFIWHKKNSAKGVPPKNMVVNIHETILCYSKRGKSKLLGEMRTDETFANSDNDKRGLWRRSNIKSTLENEKSKFTIIDPVTGNEFTNFWSFSKETLARMIKENRIIFPKNPDGLPKQKEFLNEFANPRMPVMSNLGLFHSQDVTEKFIDNMMEGKFFIYRKPLDLIKKIIEQGSVKEDTLILDFFAGSGTTGQAVLDLNKHDGKNRKFILCTNNENRICDEVCYPRIKKVIEGYRSTKGEKVAGLGGNLKYYKTDFVDAKQTDKNKKKLVDKSTEMLCLKEDCFGVVKKGQNFKIFTNNHDKYLGIIYDDTGITDFKKEVQKLNRQVSTYVFSLDDSAREEEFDDIEKLVDLKPIPAVILNVYKRIFK